jgi:hypothetical protein
VYAVPSVASVVNVVSSYHAFSVVVRRNAGVGNSSVLVHSTGIIYPHVFVPGVTSNVHHDVGVVSDHPVVRR